MRATLKTDLPFYMATSVPDAVAALKERGKDGAPLAGATWAMRAGLRRERTDWSYVAINKLEELRRVAIDIHEISIGACVTHAELARAVAALPDCQVLVNAAGKSANPAIRQVATVGGNLCARGFPAADLIPALLCLDAQVEIQDGAGAHRVSLQHFLKMRSSLETGSLVRGVSIPRTSDRTSHQRLPLRKAGDYPVAIVSVSMSTAADGTVSNARVAVGSVEATARRWERLESALLGSRLDPNTASVLARETADEFEGRDGVEANRWYRMSVLPALVRRAVLDISRQDFKREDLGRS
jgi:carbon-monoxide dehydrogenase medium subunit